LAHSGLRGEGPGAMAAPHVLLRRLSSGNYPRNHDFKPQFGMVSRTFVDDRSCNQKLHHMAKKPLLDAITRVFQELCENSHCVFGNGISLQQAKMLAVLARPRELKQGEILFREGDVVSDFFVVIDGAFSEYTVASDIVTHQCGSIIGEVGMLDGLDKGHALVTALQDSWVAALPYRKFVSFLERSGGDLSDRVLGFVTRVLFPELMAIEGARMSHSSAVLLQCAMRYTWAGRKMTTRRHQVHVHKALIIQRAWRRYIPRVKIWRELKKPFGVRIQCSIRSMLARRKASHLRWIRGIMEWYSTKEADIIVLQRHIRHIREKRKQGHSFKRKSSGFNRRTSVYLAENEDGYSSDSMPAKSATPDSHMESPLGVASRQLNIFRASSNNSSGGLNESQMDRNDLASLRKWLLRDMAKCLTAWKRHVREMQRKRHMMKTILKSLKYGNHYHYFKRWKTAAMNAPDVITPWRSHAGQTVQLSAEGKEYEFALGRRLQGDGGIGVLLTPLLKDKTVWKVQWKGSGLIGAYFTGSCGRFFLKRVEQKKKKRRKLGADDISTLAHGLEEIREAMDENRGGLQVSMSVTPPFGANIGFSCPSGSPWRLEVKFLPKSVQQTVAVNVKAREAAEFGCSRNELGIVVSPVVQVRHRTWRKFSKPFSLRIPHRCSSAQKLILFHWPEDQIFCDKVQGAEFTDEECTAEVTGFGLYAVINTDPTAPDVVYGKLDVGKRWRDKIGKMVTRMNLGTTHRNNVALIPRGVAEDFEGASVFLPCFHLRNGTMIERVDALPDIKLEGCILNCWSGRVKYKGGLTSIDFSIIIQTSPTEPLPFNMPLFDCSILLKNSNDNVLIAFSNGNHVRMKVTTVELCIQVGVHKQTCDFIDMLLWCHYARQVDAVNNVIKPNDIMPVQISAFSRTLSSSPWYDLEPFSCVRLKCQPPSPPCITSACCKAERRCATFGSGLQSALPVSCLHPPTHLLHLFLSVERTNRDCTFAPLSLDVYTYIHIHDTWKHDFRMRLSFSMPI